MLEFFEFYAYVDASRFKSSFCISARNKYDTEIKMSVKILISFQINQSDSHFFRETSFHQSAKFNSWIKLFE